MTTLTTNAPASRSSQITDHAVDLRGSYIGDDAWLGRTRCVLQIGRTNIPVDIPAEVLEKHQMMAHDEIVLRIPGEKRAAVQAARSLSAAEQQAADRWITEMQDFDRF